MRLAGPDLSAHLELMAILVAKGPLDREELLVCEASQVHLEKPENLEQEE